MGEGVIFDVQRFSVHDGPGIRTTVFFKGCLLRCPWCQNPESLCPSPELAFHVDRCRRESSCVPACPRGALRLTGDRVLREACNACGDCVAACPHGALRVVGRMVTVEALVAEVLRDAHFYRASGGGVTVSGGEPTLQMRFLGEFARRCREHGVGVGLQTCGVFRRETFEPHLPLFDFIHFDLKIVDGDRHREVTGAGNRRILANARWLAASGAPVLFRLPVVPSYTDTDSNLRDVAAFLRELGVSTIDLLRYHALGESKLAALGFPLRPLGLAASPDEALGRAQAILRSLGLEVAA